MKSLLVVVLCAAIPVTMFGADAQNGYKVTYDGGTLGDTKAGSGLKIIINSSNVTFEKDKTELLTIPASSITEISYGQDVHRRIGTAVAVGVFTLGAGALIALSKSKKHFVGLTWADGNKKGGLAVQCDKSDFRGILAALEGVTGKKAVDSADSDKKATLTTVALQTTTVQPEASPADNVQAEPAAQPATVIVKSTPPGADINVDGKWMGSTPSTIQLAPGDHEVSIEKEGMTPWQRTMTVTVGGSTTIDATLVKP